MAKRKNGLQFPWSFKQWVSYLAYIAYGSTYNIFVIPHIYKELEILFYLLFNISLLTSILLHLATGFINPADPLTYNSQSIHTDFPIIHRCTLCQSPIQLFSKHCVSCDKCIYSYDHHCFWVNNCIGGKNYKIFFAMVVSNTILVCVTSSYCIVALVNEIDYIDTDDYDSAPAYIIFYIITGTLSLLATVYLGYILIFHIYMWHLGMSTYEYVVKKRNRIAVAPANYDWQKCEFANKSKDNIE